MDLFEYQGKQLFASFDIPVPPGAPALTAEQAVEVAEQHGYPVVVKAQVHVGGRGKAGGIKLAGDAHEVAEHAREILGMDIKGHTVGTVWIERASDIAEEYYASYTLDRAAKLHVGMLSREGGVDIEEVAATNPDSIARIRIDPVDGLTDAQCRAWIVAADLPEQSRDRVHDLLRKLYRAYTEGDCDLVEINPLILTSKGEILALDAKVTLDDSAAFRHPEWESYRSTQVLDHREAAALAKGLQYVGLEGSVGIIANGAGLAMSTCDVVNQVGGAPANFLDIGGGANAEVMTNALEVVNNDSGVRSIFINVFGGITRGEEVAKGIVAALGQVDLHSPIVIRLDGTNAEEGRAILKDHESDMLLSRATMLDAARTAVELAGAGA